MATGSSATVSGLPEGYTLEQPSSSPQTPSAPQAGGVPEGYTLEQPGQATANTPPPADASYLSKVNTGPLAPAGQAEKAMGEGLTNKEQAKEGLLSLAKAAGYTASAMIPGAGEIAPEAPELINAAGEPISEGAKSVMGHLAKTYGEPVLTAIKEASEAHPIIAKLLMHGIETATTLKAGKYLGMLGK